MVVCFTIIDWFQSGLLEDDGSYNFFELDQTSLMKWPLEESEYDPLEIESTLKRQKVTVFPMYSVVFEHDKVQI